MSKKTVTLIITSAIVGCIVLNTLALGAYHWKKAYDEWKDSDWKVAAVTSTLKPDYGHEPEEMALNMDTELLKQMEKAVKNELKYRTSK